MKYAYPEFVVGGVYRFDGADAYAEYGDWTVVAIEPRDNGERIYAACTTGRYKNPCSCMVDTRDGEPFEDQYRVTRVDDDLIEPEDWS